MQWSQIYWHVKNNTKEESWLLASEKSAHHPTQFPQLLSEKLVLIWLPPASEGMGGNLQVQHQSLETAFPTSFSSSPHSLCREQHKLVIRASIAAQTKSIQSKSKPKLLPNEITWAWIKGHVEFNKFEHKSPTTTNKNHENQGTF